MKADASVTDAIYESGSASSSRFYEDSAKTLGMKPSEYRNGAEGIRIRFMVEKNYLGWVLIGATDKGICTMELGDSPDNLKKRLFENFPKAVIEELDDRFNDWIKKILLHLENPNKEINLPLDIQGTAFQRKVWQVLREIPVGSTASYSEIAEKIGKPKAERAVAGACASNKIAVAIPCHRAVRQNGELGGYRWRVKKKRSLLKQEKN